MSSWTLLRRLVDFWASAENPLFRRDIRHVPAWSGFAGWLGRSTGFTFPLVGLMCYLIAFLAFKAPSVWIVLAPLMLAWMLLVGVALAPVVVRERQQRTWEMLLVTPLPTENLVLGKAGGALWWLRSALNVMNGLLFVAGLGVGIAGVVVYLPSVMSIHTDVPVYMVCGIGGVLWAGAAVIFVIDRVQQFVLITLIATLASTLATSVSTATVAACAAVLIAWLGELAASWAILLASLELTGGVPDLPLIRLSVLGPVATVITRLPLLPMLGSMAAILALRELAIRGLWRWIMRSVRAV